MADLQASLNRIQALAEAATPGKRHLGKPAVIGLPPLIVYDENGLRIADTSNLIMELGACANNAALIAATDREVMLAFVAGMRALEKAQQELCEEFCARDNHSAVCILSADKLDHLSRILAERLSDG